VTTTIARGLVAALTGWALLARLESQEPPNRPEATSLLGRPLFAPALPPETRRRYEERRAEAQRAYDHTPSDPDSIIWLGRRTAYLGRYREAIEIYSRGIRLHPEEARLYRHRGHRYLTVRELDRAIEDLSRAYQLVQGQADQVEPDGLPNARGIPTSTLHSNIRYHLGLAHYLKGDFERALPYYREDITAAVNHDMLVATSHWLYMALRRLGRDAEAAGVLAPITAELEVIENQSYHRLLLLYRGALSPDQVLAGSALGAAAGGAADPALQDVTVSYGIGNWHLYNGRPDQARRIFNRILGTTQWAAFGYLAAEAEVARERGGRGGRGPGPGGARAGSGSWR
jgi:hypothetical protein